MKILLAVVLFIILKLVHAADSPYRIETLLTQKDVIWGFDFLKTNSVLFTERSGKIFIFELSSKKMTEVSGVPKVYAEGQGGMLDLRVHPKNNFI
jgi:hypothetical protein